MKKKFQQKKENVRRVLTKYDKGLTNYQVNLRKSQGLSNNTQIKVNRTYLDIFLKNFVTFFNILLIAIGVILIAAGKWDSCVFLVILIANISIGLFQDIRAKRMVDKLSLTTKSKVKVVREGRIKFIDSEDIVLDDVLIIGNDEIIPCDGRVLTGTASLNESLLTGESLPVKKIVGDVVYSGTYVTNGDIRIRVEKVGSENYIQQLQAKSKVVKRQKSLIYKQLNYLFKIISIIVIVVGIFMLVEYGYIKDAFSSLIMSISSADYLELSKSILDLCYHGEIGNIDEFNMAIFILVSKYVDMPLDNINIEDVFNELIGIIREFRLTLPSNIMLLIKSLIVLEGVARNLDKEVKLIEHIKPFAFRYVKEQMKPDNLFKQFKKLFYDYSYIIKEFPSDLEHLVSVIKQGSVKIQLEHKKLESLASTLDGLADRLSYSIVLASLILASALIITSKMPPLFHGTSVIGMIGFGISAIMGFIMIISRFIKKYVKKNN